MLSEGSQTVERTCCVIPLIEKSRKCKLINNDRKQISDGLRIERQGAERLRTSLSHLVSKQHND